MKKEKAGKKKAEKGESVKGMSEKQMEETLDKAVNAIGKLQKEKGIAKEPVEVKASKPISKLKKGDKIKIDSKSYEIDAHYVLMKHPNNSEMAIELFDSNDKDFQLRYFDDQAEATFDFYELQEIMYFKKAFKKVEW